MTKIDLNGQTYMIDDTALKEFIESKGKVVALSPEVTAALCPVTADELRPLIDPMFLPAAEPILAAANKLMDARRQKALAALG